MDYRFRMSVGLLALTMSTIAFSQVPQKVAFEVASIREGALELPSMTVTGNRVEIRNYQLLALLLKAFDVPRFRLSGPDWLADSLGPRFNVQAIIPADSSRKMVPDMLRTLLIERFGLVSHVEARPLPFYHLVVGSAGIRIREVEPIDEMAKAFTLAPGAQLLGDSVRDEVRTIQYVQDGVVTRRILTPRTIYEQKSERGGTMRRLHAASMTMTELASLLSGNADRPVIDRTGLAGNYQFTVDWPAPQTRIPWLTTDVNGDPIEFTPSGASASSVAERLGLKLEPQQSPIDIIVIDKLSRTPTEN